MSPNTRSLILNREFEVGDVVLLEFPQAGSFERKLRPALVLVLLPGPFQTVLLAGISTSVRTVVAEWDERLSAGEPWFRDTGLKRDSVARLSYLYAAEDIEIVGRIGRVPVEVVQRQRARFAAILSSPIS